VKQGHVMQRLWIALGAIAGLITVAMAALAAHALPGIDPLRLAILRSAIEMQALHALALLACGLWVPRGGRLADGAGAAFGLGTLLFSGALYSSTLTGVHLGPMAPIGGGLLMLGWALLGLSASLTWNRA
jgi:uncharacterized membrane protein YgdD (TMEM256/DUF423 family)